MTRFNCFLPEFVTVTRIVDRQLVSSQQEQCSFLGDKGLGLAHHLSLPQGPTVGQPDRRQFVLCVVAHLLAGGGDEKGRYLYRIRAPYLSPAALVEDGQSRFFSCQTHDEPVAMNQDFLGPLGSLQCGNRLSGGAVQHGERRIVTQCGVEPVPIHYQAAMVGGRHVPTSPAYACPILATPLLQTPLTPSPCPQPAFPQQFAVKGVPRVDGPAIGQPLIGDPDDAVIQDIEETSLAGHRRL